MTRPLTWLLCGAPLKAEGPAVCEIRSKSGDVTWGWVAFIEDWRGGYTDMIHPVCFAERHGVAELIEVVHQRDTLERGEIPRLMMEVDDMRRRVAGES